MHRPIYLDYAATTPVDPRVAARMADYLTREGVFGNPASRSHGYGQRAEEAVERSRRQVADLIKCLPEQLIWTSGATESNNLAIKGVAHALRQRGRHLVTVMTEHKSVLDPCRFLAGEGYEVSYLAPDSNGLLDPEVLEAAVRDDTILVSVMHVNNEIGVIQDIASIGERLRRRGVLFHVDAAQSAGKVPIDLRLLPVDLMSLSAHKVYGPKGVGALFLREGAETPIEPQMHGGGHERGLRSGTLATHQIVGMGEAFQIAGERLSAENERIRRLRDRLWEGIRDLPDVFLNGDREARVSGNLNVSFAGVEGESLMMALNDIAVSSGSACSSANREPSYVLRALGRSDELADGSIRFSLGRYTTEAEVDRAIEIVRDKVQQLRALSTRWRSSTTAVRRAAPLG
ncbi:MAG: IscS subfamily cysteine desulfurase [Gammaproteobacteria bacterium]